MVSVPVKIKPDHSQISLFNAGQEGVKRQGNKGSGSRTKIRCRECDEYEKRHMKMEPVCIVNAGNEMKHRKSGDRMKWAEGNISNFSENWVLHTLFSVSHRSRIYGILFICRDFLIYSRDPCACSDQLHFGGFFVHWQLVGWLLWNL